MTYDVKKVISVATNEIGYLEKATNSQLNDKTANTGFKNFTKYGLSQGCNGQPWCDAFVDWCFIQAYGNTDAKKLLGNFSNYTPTSAQYFKNMKQWHLSNPQIGDIIFFKNNIRICHTGLVYKVDVNRVYTIEGNTSSINGMVANGGGVHKKSYSLSYSKIAGYGRPEYDEDSSSTIKDIIREGQEHAIKFTKIQIKVDGVVGKETERMKSRVLQHAINLDYNDSLNLDGDFGTKSKKALGNHFVKKGAIQYMVTAVEILMMLNGIDPNGVEYPGYYGNGLTRAAKQFFDDDGLKITSSEFLKLI